MKRLALLIGTIAALIPFGAAFAIEDPDSMTINSIDCYEGVVQPEDELCVVYYEIDYATPPTETVTQAFVGRFFKDGVETNSVAPFTYTGSVSTTTPPYKGYGQGIFSFYWNAAQAATAFGGTTYSVKLQGNPTVFAGTPPEANSSSVSFIGTPANTLLQQDIAEKALLIQTNWSGNDITLLTTASNQTVLTLTGQTYFTNAIPGLSQMTPLLFTNQLQQVALTDVEVDPSVATTFENLYNGTALEDPWTAFGSFFGLSSLVGRVALSLVLMMAVAVGVTIAAKGRADFGVFIGFGPMPPLLIYLGLLPFAAGAIIILMAVIGIVFVKLYGR